MRIEQVERRLDNGMRVVVHTDRSSPIVAVHVMYGVGSRDERPGRTGLAHLLEHLLFEGSQNCGKGEFDRLLERAGGTNNGSTWLDRTNYYEVVPTHAVELALWLERERMGFFLPVLDSAMLELQRGVVINERRQSYENRPYGLADERLHQLLFAPDHPYSWPTIGYMADLEAITLDDAREFFATYYTPRNTVLVLAGDIDPETGFQLAERFFGDLDAGPGRPATASSHPGHAGGTDQLTDRVSFPRWHRAHAVAPYGSLDWTTLDVMTYLLADGESSRLQRRLVRDDELAQEVDAFLYPTALTGVFGVVSTARSGVALEEVASAIDETLAELKDSVVPEEELAGAVRRARRDHLAALSNVEERAEQLAYATTVLGSPGRLNEALDGYAAVTPEEIQRCAALYLDPDAAARLAVVPRER